MERKIDLIKRKFPSTDFKDPFRSGKAIIEKIIVKLFGSTQLKFSESENKAALLKQIIDVKVCSIKQFYQDELPHLDSDKNFWLLVIKLPMGPNIQVYDCKYEPLRSVLYMLSSQNEHEFCVVDKKYSWLLFFKLNRAKDTVEIYRSGYTDMMKPQLNSLSALLASHQLSSRELGNADTISITGRTPLFFKSGADQTSNLRDWYYSGTKA